MSATFLIIMNHFASHLPCPCSWMQTLGQCIDCRTMVVPAHMRGIRIKSRCLHLEPQTIITDKIPAFHASTFIDQCTMETMQGFLWKPVHLADTKRIIAQITKHLRHLITIPTSNPTITQHAMMPGRQPRQQSGTGWRTARRRRITVKKKGAIMSQSIQMRSEDRRIAHAIHCISPMLVGHNQNNMRFLLCRQKHRHQTRA